MVEDLEFIKNFYSPIQPTIKTEQSEIIYQEVVPAKAIHNFVHCYWQLKTNNRLESPYLYRVVSDGCIDIFFDHRKPGDNFIMGFCRKYTEFSLSKEFDYIGIRFLPSSLPLLFSINARLLSNKSQPLKNVLSEVSKWIESEIHPQQSFGEVIDLLNAQLEYIIKDKVFDLDKRFFNSLYLIFLKKGNLDTENYLVTGLSPRQLRRKFNQYIGASPKAFCNVIRFQHVLNAKPTKRSLKESKLYFDAGFYDQAHFIKSFKNFYGITPSKAFY